MNVAYRLLVLALALAVAPSGAEVVRVSNVSRAEIAKLRADHDVWGLDWRAGELILDVPAEQRAALEAAGYRIETDVERNRQLAAWRSRSAETMVRGVATGTIPGFSCYRTVDRTHADLQALADDYPDRAAWMAIGDSWQAGAGSFPGDTIHALRIANPDSPHPQAPLVVVAAQHARELTTAEIATRFAELLVTNPDGDPDIEWLLDHRSIHVIAQANPDGRRRVEAGDSLWRKNHDEAACPGGDASATWTGVDLNRNGGFLWEPVDSPCGQRYSGPAMASEPETVALQDYLDAVFDVQRAASDLVTPAPDHAEGVFVSLHSFGEMVLIPWEGLGGAGENNAPNHDALTLLGRRFGALTDYAVARYSLLPPATGTAVDHAYGEFGVASYTFEVGTVFFESCADFEAEVWPANRDALLLAARAARRPYLAAHGPAVLDLDWYADDGAVVITGSADDGLYFSGGVDESPWPNPIDDVVAIEVTLNGPPETGNPGWSFAVPAPASRVDFLETLPPVHGDARLFVTAVDATGQSGLPRVVALGDLVHADGFEVQ